MAEQQSHPDGSKQAGLEVQDPRTDQEQDFQPESGATNDREEKQARRRNSIGTERVKLAPGEATEEA